MQLPSIARAKRYTLPRPTDSADALLLARTALARGAGRTPPRGHRPAEPADAQRLADELPFFAPRCAPSSSRIGRPCPTTPSHRITTWCLSAWPPCGQIEFWVHQDRVIEFEEMPISEDQKIDTKPDKNGYCRVTAKVVPNLWMGFCRALATTSVVTRRNES